VRKAYALATLLALAVLATAVAGCQGRPNSPEGTVTALLDSLERLDVVSMNELLAPELQVSAEQVAAYQQYYETLRQQGAHWSITYSSRDLNVTSRTEDDAVVALTAHVHVYVSAQGQTRTEDYIADTVVGLRKVNDTWVVEDTGGLNFAV